MPGFDISEWLDMTSDVVTIKPWVSRTVSGVPGYGTGVDYPARIEVKNHLVVNAQGDTVAAKGKVTILSSVVPTTKDEITLPVEYVPRKPPIIAIDPSNDEFGTHHVVIHFG